MKRRDLLNEIVLIIFSALIGISGTGCLVTAFALEVSSGKLLFGCVAWAVLVTVSLRWRRGWIVLLAADVLWLGYLVRQDLLEQSLTLLRIILRLYDKAYGWGMPSFLTGLPVSDVTIAAEAVIGLCTMAAGISLNRKKTAGAVLAVLLPLIPCLVVTDTPPHSAFFFLALLCVALTLLSQTTRRADARQGSRLLVMLLIPVVLVNGLLFWIKPQEDYVRPEQSELFDRITVLLNKLPFVDLDPDGDLQLGTGHYQGAAVNLEAVGPKILSDNVALWVTSSYGGTIYLRGRHYSNYNGESWTANSGQESDLQIELAQFRGQLQTLRITSLRMLSAMYLSYYPTQTPTTQNGMQLNSENLRAYTHEITMLTGNWKSQWKNAYGQEITLEAMDHYSSEWEQYLQLPQHTKQATGALLQQTGISDRDDVVSAAEKIGRFVQNSARYDLNTQRMPASEMDFAIWFLKESDTGYCVHFASAAAVLLRAAGIPARYVEGYSAQVQEGGANVVRDRNAHAWVEYFVPKVGWVILEATPAAFREEQNPTAPPTEPATNPSYTTAPPQSSQSGTSPTTPPVTTQPGAATLPNGTLPSDPAQSDQGNVDLSWLRTALEILILLGACICLALGQWQLRLRLRRKALQRGSANAQALRRWQFARYLARLRRQEAPEALHDLAKKAKFSQYTLTEAELAQFDGYFARSIAHLRSRPWPMRLVYRLIFAAY